MAGGDLGMRPDLDFEITLAPEPPPPEVPQSLGGGYLVLVARELTGLSQRRLADEIGTSQSTLATIETGNRLPTIRTLLRVAEATGLELVLGLRRPVAPGPDHLAIRDLGFALLGTLHRDPDDGLANLLVLREPRPSEGPDDADD
jgi:transcriptional regulator with XRE-family HTH domain